MKMQILLTKENKQSTPLSILPFNWIRAIGGEKGPIGFNQGLWFVREQKQHYSDYSYSTCYSEYTIQNEYVFRRIF